MKIAMVRPDFGVSGGYEGTVGLLRGELTRRGHTVEVIPVVAKLEGFEIFGLSVPERVAKASFEFIRHADLLARFAALDVSGFDLAVSTGPPSYAINHPRHIAVFYHHVRVMYDLAEHYVGAGFALGANHVVSMAAWQRLDLPYLRGIGRFLSPPETIERLRHYHGFENIADFYMPSPLSMRLQREPISDASDHVLCISRVEWPKRVELFVHAMKYLPHLRAVIVGEGNRLNFTRALDARLSAPGIDLDSLKASDTWFNSGALGDNQSQVIGSNVTLLTNVNDDDLARLVHSASCVVAPAFKEDYGLTAIEGMAAGKPIVVTDDGGGFRRSVDDGVTGLVVPPAPRALAKAIEELHSNRKMARRFGDAGRVVASRITLQRAVDVIEENAALLPAL